MSRRGNDAGYALIDAMISVFMLAIASASVLSAVSLVARSSAKSHDGAVRIIERRNALAERQQTIQE
jgi:Tfp pilus assembly protein PilV